MNPNTFLILCLLLVVLTSGCRTTGDPHIDTIWFSPAKARNEIAVRRKAVEEQNGLTRNTQDENERLRRQKQEIDVLTARLERAIADEEAQLTELRKKNSAPNKELAVLGQSLEEARGRLHLVAKRIESDVNSSERLKIEMTAVQARIASIHQRIQVLFGEPRREEPEVDLR